MNITYNLPEIALAVVPQHLPRVRRQQDARAPLQTRPPDARYAAGGGVIPEDVRVQLGVHQEAVVANVGMRVRDGRYARDRRRRAYGLAQAIVLHLHQRGEGQEEERRVEESRLEEG